MKICAHCGERNFDIKTECDRCHRPFVTTFVSKRTSLNKVVSAFMILAMIGAILEMIVSIFFWIVSLYSYNVIGGHPTLAASAIIYFVAWVIFFIRAIIVGIMIGAYHKKTSYGYPASMAFKVCTLLFVSLISGILMLCDD